MFKESFEMFSLFLELIIVLILLSQIFSSLNIVFVNYLRVLSTFLKMFEPHEEIG